ncbi:MAG: ABC transporter permease [Myxococcales bacterium]|nr:ABC transporter permease [Myxococcales bacterium]MBL0193003.1 ABC transporter permease [Myxococcales bacterium]HQY62741.1 ABC transporter permease [Polyangiaceae bacterium]
MTPWLVGLLVFVAVASLLIVWRGVAELRAGHRGRFVVALLGAAAGIGFVRLTYWTTQLPVLRGSAWSLKDAAVRAGALASGLVFLWTGLAILVPVLFDLFEKRAFSLFVAVRHVRSQKSGFLSVISVLSIAGVSISSCALCDASSVMGGFSADLKRKILGNNAHIVVDQESLVPFADGDALLERIRKAPHVVGASPVLYGEVMITSNSNLAGVVVRGVDTKTIGQVIDLPANIELGKLEYLDKPEALLHLDENEIIGRGPGGEPYTKGPELLGFDLDPITREKLPPPPVRPGIVVGRELAKTLHVYVGDEVTLISPLGDLGPMGVMPKTKRFRVAAVFFSGMYEYDASHVYTTLGSAQDYFGMRGKVSAIDVKVDEPELADFDFAAFDKVVARPELRVRDWRGINKNLFSALKVEKIAVFLILTMITVVASFCIICTLLLLVTEKTKDIAILKALGASDGAILRTFIMEGVVIGTLGTVFGVSSGAASCIGLKWFGVRLDPDVYYIDRLPIAVNPADFALVAASAIVICTLATIYPALAAASIRPVDGLRFE